MYNYFGFVLSAASVGTGWSFLSLDCGNFDFLEFLCMRYKVFLVSNDSLMS